MQLSNGDTYQGEIQNSKYHGHGRYVSAIDKSIFEG